MCFWAVWDAIVRAYYRLTSRLRRRRNVQRTQQEQLVRVLMFGPSDVGKTTMMRNLILNYGDFGEDFTHRSLRFTETYMQNVIRPLIYQGMISNMNLMTNKTRALGLSLSSAENEAYASHLLELQGEDLRKLRVFTEDIVASLRELWADPVLKSVYANHRNDFKLSGNLFYFAEKLDEVADPDYIPSEEDLLHTRWPTIGINQYYFVIENVKFKITDIGGDRHQRVNYRQYVDDFLRDDRDYTSAARVIIFVASLADYNQAHPDYGPDEVNPRNQQRYTLLDDAQGIFRLIASREELRESMLLLFLNKSDFFRLRLEQYRDFGLYFPDCPNPSDFDTAVQSVRQYFEQALEGPGQYHNANDLFTLTTCAIDKRIMRIIMAMARLHILWKIFGHFIADLPA